MRKEQFKRLINDFKLRIERYLNAIDIKNVDDFYKNNNYFKKKLTYHQYNDIINEKSRKIIKRL
jgi:hypothetical protein